MGSIGTFGSFTQARLGIYAAQSGLSVTGNNISNINTTGYTRQKLEQTSFYAGGSDRYYSTYDLRIGNGALCRSVSQLRDPYLDIRYRSEMSSVGAMDAKLAGLENIQRILDEVGDGDDAFGILGAQFSDFFHQLEQLSDQTGLSEYDIQVRSSAEALTKQFNSYAAQLQEVYDNAVTAFNQDITVVNNILTNIRDLNSTIRKAEIHGDNALELRDERNLLIDKLSSYMKIDVLYTEEDIGGGTMVEKLTIKLGDANPDQTSPNDTATLVDGVYAVQLSIPDQIQDAGGNLIDNENFTISLGPLKDSKDRLLYSTSKLGAERVAGYNGPSSTSETDPNTGVITITTYAKTKDTVPRTNDQNQFLDKDGNVVATAEQAEQLPVYLKTTYEKIPSTELQLADNDLYGAIQSQREMLTESGEFTCNDTIQNVDPNAASKRGIPFYQKALDLLANQFAKTFNEANQGYVRNEDGYCVSEDGTVLTLNGEPISADGLSQAQIDYLKNHPDPTVVQKYVLADGTIDTKAYMEDAGGQFLGAPLFSNLGSGNETDGITASNISISLDWQSGPQIVNSFVQHGSLDIGSTDSSNIAHMLVLMDKTMNYDPTVIDPDAASTSMFQGDFNEMWVNIGSILGNDMMSTSTMLDTYYASSVELDTGRDSVSSVDLNDEAMNLMQYSKSYNAACRLMTTLDSVLDKLINGTGMTT